MYGRHAKHTVTSHQEHVMGDKRTKKKRRRKRRVSKEEPPFSRHHLLPKSRGGTNRLNLVTLPHDFHKKWHEMFGLMTPNEAKMFISQIMIPGVKWTQEEINRRRSQIIERHESKQKPNSQVRQLPSLQNRKAV